ncbi:kelch domain-containing protein 4-like [Leptopilina boulardi]|uniref:kelch domain-containing protein 4-like n=1 Tax=Leptopilina boulardi TaxID=63433 RepID=UPI0021F6083D|nr:kelch domain-containing protein 4-like [Leptopilina boulardi]
MGKKNKNKKMSGMEKTALKTEKKLNSKRKKELSDAGEDDIEKIIANIEKEEAKRNRVTECIIAPPSRRVNFTLSVHPFKDELIMFGGEFHNGQKTIVYNDLFFYNLNKKEWSVIKVPGAPPPRCGHQASIVPSGKGDLWIFGGEYTSQSESQFYHYRDLWVYRLGEKKWEKITAPGGPTARSGHRMTYMKKQLFIFGGFHDNLRDYKYFNDVYIFDLSSYTWSKIEVSGNSPNPRSGCIVLPTPDNKLLVYGGYSKQRIKKDVDKGQVHTDMFLLAPDKNDSTGTKWKWTLVNQGGIKLSPRCSSTAILVQQNLAYLFGGVYDDDDNEEDLSGKFYNDLIALNLEKYQWYTVTLNPKLEQEERKKRRKEKGTVDEEEEEESMVVEEPVEEKIITTDDDGIFTMTVGPAPKTSSSVMEETKLESFTPCPRINPGLAVKNNNLYLYGGMFEDGNKQYTFNDFYYLDCKKLDKWTTIIKDDLSSQEWLGSSSSEDESTDECDTSSDEESPVEMDIDKE